MDPAPISLAERRQAKMSEAELRDYLAGQALVGIAFDCGLSAEEAADKAYTMADAMMRRRRVTL